MRQILPHEASLGSSGCLWDASRDEAASRFVYLTCTIVHDQNAAVEKKQRSSRHEHSSDGKESTRFHLGPQTRIRRSKPIAFDAASLETYGRGSQQPLRGRRKPGHSELSISICLPKLLLYLLSGARGGAGTPPSTLVRDAPGTAGTAPAPAPAAPVSGK